MGTREMEELNNIRKQEALEEEMRKKNSKDKSEKRFNYVFQILLVLKAFQDYKTNLHPDCNYNHYEKYLILLSTLFHIV